MDSLDLQRKRKEENKHKEKQDYTWEIFFAIAIPFVIVMMVWGTMTYEKEEKACRDIGGKYEVVDRHWNVATKTYMSEYDCVK